MVTSHSMDALNGAPCFALCVLPTSILQRGPGPNNSCNEVRRSGFGGRQLYCSDSERRAASLPLEWPPPGTFPMTFPSLFPIFPRRIRDVAYGLSGTVERSSMRMTASSDNDLGTRADTHSQRQVVSSSSSSSVFGSGTFSALGMERSICEALDAIEIRNPTRVQQRAIPAVLGGADVIVGAATGSGKTFAYLLPVVAMLKSEEELYDDEAQPLRVVRRPRAIILLPTRELAEQALAVAKGLSHHVKYRVVGTASGTGSAGMKKLRTQLASSPVDVLVTTTGRLLQLMDAKAVDLRFTKHVVIDEVDTMFDEGFGPELQRILRACRGSKAILNKPQCIAVGATHPKAAETMYAVEFPNAKRVDVDLHLPPPGLDARFIRTTAEGKLAELVALLGDSKELGDLRGGRMIVFCNTVSSTRFVEHFLTESGYSTSSVHGEIPPERRAREFKRFKSGDVQILVCTDVAARGLDNLEITHVVIFDFPTSAVDYIHRAGRTARAGAEGRVTSLVLKRDLGLARSIERSGKEKHDALVSARIAREEEAAAKARNAAGLLESRAARAAEMAEEEEGQKLSSSSGPRRTTGSFRGDKRYPRSWTEKRRGGRGGSRFGSKGSRQGPASSRRRAS